MKRKLSLLRHSYAEPLGSSLDLKRNLTMEGLSAIRTLGRRLLNDNFSPDKIICSTAIRAQQTAINLVEELEMSEQMISYDEKIYEASVRELVEVVNEIQQHVQSALIIGHSPAISFFGEYLTSSGIEGMEPCSMVTIGFDGVEWREISQSSGNLVSYCHPTH